MSDWDFLYEMHDRGCSADEIIDAAASGYAPWELIDEDESKQPPAESWWV